MSNLANPFPIQKASITYGPDVVYGLLAELFSQTGGVAAASHFKCSQHSVANLGVDVAVGTAYVPSTQAQDLRRCTLTATSNTVTTSGDWANGYSAADPTNPRVDAIVVQLNDSNIDASGLWSAQLKVLTGTPTGGATLVNLNGAPTPAANQLLLAYTLLPAGATTITTANILDARRRVQIGVQPSGYGIGAAERFVLAGAVLPTAPFDGDQVVYQADANNNINWALRYNGGSSADAAHPWEFIGGAPMQAETTGSSTTASNAYADLADGTHPTLVVPRTGYYVCEISCVGSIGAAGDVANVAINTTSQAAADANSVQWTTAVNGYVQQPYKRLTPILLQAGETLSLKYKVNAGTLTALRRQVALTPVRLA